MPNNPIILNELIDNDCHMNLNEVISLLNARVICGEDKLQKNIASAFASDLMSDVLTIESDNLLLITGLANLQTIRTAEMSDISSILFVRGKRATPEMIELATENHITLLECEGSMFKTAGVLYNAGIKPVF
jgi:predicted transcriptional regulator